MKKNCTLLSFAIVLFLNLSGFGNQLSAANITSTASGNWSLPSTWAGGVVPSSSDDVTITAGNTVNLDVSATVLSLNVSGTLVYDAVQVVTLTLNGNVTVPSGGVLTSPVSGTVITDGLTINGDLSVSGNFNMNVFSTAGVGVTFTGATNNSISGTGTINFQVLTINKGAGITSVLEDVNGTVITIAKQTIVTNGTFKVSSASTLSPTSSTLINAAGKLLLNNSGLTLNGVGIIGTLQVDAGIVNEGLTSQLSQITGNLIINGANATVNHKGGLAFTSTSTFTMTNGNLNIDPQGLNSIYHSLDFQSISASAVTATGGNITIVNPVANKNGFAQVLVSGSGIYNFAGSTLRFGDGVSTLPSGTAGYGFSFQSGSAVFGNVIVNNPSSYAGTDRIVRLYGTTNIGGNLTVNAGVGNVFQLDGMGSFVQTSFVLNLGGNLINNGTFTGSYSGSTLNLNGTTTQTIRGTGTYNGISYLVLNNTSGSSPGVDVQANLNVMNSLTLTNGSMNSSNASVLTLGSASTAMTINSYGGSLLLAPTFTPSSIFSVTYNSPTPAASITTGNEIPSIVSGTLVINNSSGVTLNKPVSCGILTLTAGNLTTSAVNSITITGTTAASITGGSATTYVNGPLTRTIPSSGLTAGNSNFKFPVGKAAYHLFEYANIITGGSGNGTYTVESFDAGPYAGVAGYGISAINTDKYWSLIATLGTETITSSQIRITDTGLGSTSKIGQSNTLNGIFVTDGGVLGTGTVSSGKAIDYSLIAAGTYFRTGLQGGGITPGTYAIGPNGPYAGYSGTYTSTQAAANAVTDIVLGGNFIFEYQPDYNSSVETYPITLPPALSGTSTSSITFRPSSSVTTLINFTNAGNVINNTGADYVIFDGRPGGAGTSKFLQFTNSDITTHTTPTIILTGDATYNQFLYCVLKGINTTATNGIAVINTPVAGNNNNTFSYCNFDGSLQAINCLYSTGVALNTTVSFNNFTNYKNGAAIYLISSDNAVIDNNSIYQATAFSGIIGTTTGILVNTGANCQISNNKIGGSGPGLNGTWTVAAALPVAYNFTGINATNLSTTSRIYRNRIQNFDWKSTPATWIGITASGMVNIGTDGANFIGNNTGNDSIKVTYYTNGAATIKGIEVSSGTIVNVENNIVGSITTLLSGVTGVGSSITGISNSATTGTVRNNIIGSKSIPKSINAANQTTNGNAQNIYGIVATGTTTTITGNTVANLNSDMTYTSGCSMSGIVLNSTTTGSITNNIVDSLSTSGAGSTIKGIDSEATSATTLSITGNTVYELINPIASGAITLNGIYVNANSAGTIKVDKNMIHSFSTLSNTAVQNGINMYAGTCVFQNNVIRLGIDKLGNSVTSTAQINGIYKSATSPCNFYFNTVYIGGSGVVAGTGTIKTYAFNLATHSTEDIRNNLFINARTAPTALNYAINLNGVLTSSFNSDYNIYNGSVLANFGGDKTTLNLLQNAIPGFDMHSGFGEPLLAHPSDAMATMDLKPTNLSPAEGTGVAITTVTDDFSGALRTSNSPTDIGAYAVNVTAPTVAQDIFSPAISYTNLGNGSNLINRVTPTNFAVITDNVNGINGTTGTRPRLYYKLSANASAFGANTSAFNGWKWVEASGSTSPFSFTIDYSLLNGGPVVAGNTINYFVVAQNSATTPGVSFNPFVGAAGTSVASVTTAPTMPNSYIIATSITSPVNVGSSETIKTLTGTGGLFATINAGTISTNMVVNITSDITEPGTTALNLVNEEGLNGGALTLTIKSDGTPHIISATGLGASTPMISISGAKRLILDGGAGKLLTFRNTFTTPASTGPVIQFSSNSQNDTIRNCYIESNSTTAANGAVTIGTGTNNVTLNQNDIRDARGGTLGSPTTGVYCNNNGNILNITNNNIYNQKNAASYGIYLNNFSSGSTVSGNSLYCESGISAVGAYTGIYVANSTNSMVSGNYIGGSAPLCAGSVPFAFSGNTNFTGIYISSYTAPSITIQGNTIQNISLTNTSPTFYGINNYYSQNTVSGNTIGSATTANSLQISGTGTSYGIYQSYTLGIASTIEKNTIANISLTNATGSPTFTAMLMTGGTVRKNTIFNIGSSVAALTPIIYGISNLFGVTTTNEFSNNVIALNGGASTNPTIYGYYENSGSGTTGFYFNSINLYGTSGANASYCFNRNSNGIYIANNNILANYRTGGSGNQYSIYSIPATLLTSNYNDLYAAGTVLGHFGLAGGGNDKANLAAIQAVPSDLNSISVDPSFTSTTNLNPVNNSPVKGSGLTVGSIPSDITGMLHNLTAPTIGAYELAPPVVSSPTFSLAAGTYYVPQNTVISDLTTGATIYYTTDGSTPDNTKTRYTIPISITTSNSTIKAIAYNTGMSPSAIVSNSYSIAPCISSSTGSGNWDSPSEWTLGAPVPPVGATVIVNNDLTINQDVNVSSITINPNAKLTLNSLRTLTTAILNINSDATGTGTYVDNGISNIATSNVQQYLPTGRNWYISSPVSGATSNVIKSTPANKLWNYTEANSGTVIWNEITGTSNLLGVTTGYVANMAASGNVMFTGTLNTGAIATPTLTRNGTISSGFNLVGNPYSSYLNWISAVASTNTGTVNMEPTMWYRTKNPSSTYVFDTFISNGSGGGVGTTNFSNGATAVTGFIPPMQAFWVRVAAGHTTGTLSFDNSMRSHQDQSVATNRLKAPGAVNASQPLLRLQVSNGINSDEAVVYFNPNASDGFDQFDAEKMSNNNNAIPEIYTLAGTEKVVINGLKSVSNDEVLPLGFSTGEGNTFTIKATEISNFDETIKIILKDNLLNTENELDNENAYTFTSVAASSTTRFSIVFKSTSIATGLNNPTGNESVSIYKNQNGQITVNRTNAIGEGNVTVSNALGQLLTSMPTNGSVTVVNQNLVPGVYLVKVTLAGKNISKKIIIN